MAEIFFFEKSEILQRGSNYKIFGFFDFPEETTFRIFPIFLDENQPEKYFSAKKNRAEIFVFIDFFYSSRYTKLFLPMPRRPQSPKTTICPPPFSKSVTGYSKNKYIVRKPDL